MQAIIRTTFPRIAVVILAAAARFAAAAEKQPQTPAQEQNSFRLADDELMIELVAAEPEVLSPVSVAWDADGRLFVAQMNDYPSGPAGGRVSVLEDRDGDGRYERAQILASQLKFPTSVLPWNGGVLVTAAPDILFLKDTDGDGQADERRVILTGFAEGNQQLRVNGLFWGLDHWVYGANGRSDGEIRRPGDPPSKAVSIRRHDFRFRPDTGEIEAIAGTSQFGSARDDWGNRFLSWNTIPIRHEVFPERYLNRTAFLGGTEVVASILPARDPGEVFPLTPAPLVFNNESSKHFNALAGLTIFRGDALGAKYNGNAFVGESLRNLVHRRVLVGMDLTFEAQRGEEGKEFLASTDPWFHPVNFATGPDGALYVVDFYRKFVEHPGWVPEHLRDKVPWRTGAEHGRIWRISNKKIKVKHVRPELGKASTAEIAKHLADENGWWRDTAQRLLVERQDSAAIPLLASLASGQGPDFARVQALWTLESLRALENKTILKVLKTARRSFSGADGYLLVNAVRLAEGRIKTDAALQEAVLRLAESLNPKLRLQVVLTLGEMEGPQKLERLLTIAERINALNYRWLSPAVLSSTGDRPWLFLKEIERRKSPAFGKGTGDERLQFLEQLGSLIGSQQKDEDLAECFALMTGSAHLSSSRVVLLAGLAEGLSRSGRSLPKLLRQPLPSIQAEVDPLNGIVEEAVRTALSDTAQSSFRLPAIRLLANIQPSVGAKVLPGLLFPEQPAEVQSAAVKALAKLNDDESTSTLFGNWNRYSKATRRELLAIATSSSGFTAALLNALEQEKIPVIEIDPSTRQNLQKNPDSDLQQRAQKLLQNVSSPDREQVLRNLQPALQMKGDPSRGATVFAKACLTCHTVQGKGKLVGPDLSGTGTRPKESLLVDIFDPSRQVAPDSISYTVLTKSETLTGIITTESPTRVTLRRAGGDDVTIARAEVQELRADGKSLMPDGLEQGLTQQDVADLLQFLAQPDGRLLPDAF